jgi:hypothetical protein
MSTAKLIGEHLAKGSSPDLTISYYQCVLDGKDPTPILDQYLQQHPDAELQALRNSITREQLLAKQTTALVAKVGGSVETHSTTLSGDTYEVSGGADTIRRYNITLDIIENEPDRHTPQTIDHLVGRDIKGAAEALSSGLPDPILRHFGLDATVHEQLLRAEALLPSLHAYMTRRSKLGGSAPKPLSSSKQNPKQNPNQTLKTRSLHLLSQLEASIRKVHEQDLDILEAAAHDELQRERSPITMRHNQKNIRNSFQELKSRRHLKLSIHNALSTLHTVINNIPNEVESAKASPEQNSLRKQLDTINTSQGVMRALAATMTRLAESLSLLSDLIDRLLDSKNGSTCIKKLCDLVRHLVQIDRPESEHHKLRSKLFKYPIIWDGKMHRAELNHLV